MKQLILNINDNKFRTFLEFVKTLDYVEVQEADKSLAELQNSLKQVKQMREDKIKKQSAKDFLNKKDVIPCSTKNQLKKDIKDAIENVNLVKQGKLKARPAKDLLDGL